MAEEIQQVDTQVEEVEAESVPSTQIMSESQDVTRCVCGKTEETELMIECEQCHVWQHGLCVNIPAEKYVPDHYYCEQCRPDLHPYNPNLLSKTPAVKPPIPQTLKKGRQTMNSMDSITLEEVLAMSLDDGTLKRKRKADRSTPPDNSDSDAESSRGTSQKSKRSRTTKRQARDGSVASDKPGIPAIVYEDSLSVQGTDADDGTSQAEGATEADMSDARKPDGMLYAPTPKSKKSANRQRRAGSPSSARSGYRGVLDDNVPLKPRPVAPRASLVEMCRRVRNVLEWAHRMQSSRSEESYQVQEEDSVYDMLDRLAFSLETFQAKYRTIAYTQRRQNIVAPPVQTIEQQSPVVEPVVASQETQVMSQSPEL